MLKHLMLAQAQVIPAAESSTIALCSLFSSVFVSSLHALVAAFWCQACFYEKAVKDKRVGPGQVGE
jgi:hypothetical protein